MAFHVLAAQGRSQPAQTFGAEGGCLWQYQAPAFEKCRGWVCLLVGVSMVIFHPKVNFREKFT